MTNQEQASVLIVGAGDAGLSLALLLLQQGIHPLLIERRADISIYPRARNLNFRTLEVLRGLGLTDEVRAAGAHLSLTIFKESLAASEEQKIVDPISLMGSSPDLSPDPFGWYCPQSQLEPLMLAAVRQRGGDVRYSTEMIAFTQDDAGVTATLRERMSGRTYDVWSGYLIASDGAHSRTRETLGISTQGMGQLPEYFTFVYFRAPWEHLVAGHASDAFMINNPAVQGIFMVGGEGLGLFLHTQRSAHREAVMQFTPADWDDLLHKALGDRDMPVEIVDIVHWQPAESVADQFQQGRVFLLGDAAHTMPAYKGLGANSAIQSAQNLGWKLAVVLKGQTSAGLLTTYQDERHPVGRFAAEQSLTGPGAAWLLEGIKTVTLAAGKDLPLFYPIVGYRYRSRAVLEESDGAATASPNAEITLLEHQELTGQPGTRVPHLWLEQQGRCVSTLDLLDGSFLLLTGSAGASWCEAAVRIRTMWGINLAAYRIGSAEEDADLLDQEHNGLARLGIDSGGVLLVRPDGFVAWRSNAATSTPDQDLVRVFAQILCRDTERNE